MIEDVWLIGCRQVERDWRGYGCHSGLMQSGLSVSVRLCVGREDLCNVCLTGTFIPQCWRKEKNNTILCCRVLLLTFYLTDLSCLVMTGISRLVCLRWYVSHNRDAGVATAAPTDNTAALLLFLLALSLFVWLPVCMWVRVWDADVKSRIYFESQEFGVRLIPVPWVVGLQLKSINTS